MATGAEKVSSKFLYALGYFVPETYIVYFERDRLVLADGSERVTSAGDLQDLIDLDIDVFLDDVARDPERGYRATAIRIPGSWEGLLGPYQVFGVRTDDPNDIVPHEHRRDLRGLFVFSSWLNHNRMGAVYTLDTLMIRDDVPIIRHNLVDFYATLGSGGTEPKKSFRGNEKTYDFNQTLKNLPGMGIYSPKWQRANYPKFRSVGHFEYETFEPEKWKANTTIAPFANRLPDDTYWAAKQVMEFTDNDIRAIVSTGRYSDPEAEAWIAKCLIERRDRIGATYFAKVLPLDNFEVRGRELDFDDLEIKSGFTGPANTVFNGAISTTLPKRTDASASPPGTERFRRSRSPRPRGLISRLGSRPVRRTRPSPCTFARRPATSRSSAWSAIGPLSCSRTRAWTWIPDSAGSVIFHLNKKALRRLHEDLQRGNRVRFDATSAFQLDDDFRAHDVRRRHPRADGLLAHRRERKLSRESDRSGQRDRAHRGSVLRTGGRFSSFAFTCSSKTARGRPWSNRKSSRWATSTPCTTSATPTAFVRWKASEHSVLDFRRPNASRYRCRLPLEQDASSDVQRAPDVGELGRPRRRQS